MFTEVSITATVIDQTSPRMMEAIAAFFAISDALCAPCLERFGRLEQTQSSTGRVRKRMAKWNDVGQDVIKRYEKDRRTFKQKRNSCGQERVTLRTKIDNQAATGGEQGHIKYGNRCTRLLKRAPNRLAQESDELTHFSGSRNKNSSSQAIPTSESNQSDSISIAAQTTGQEGGNRKTEKAKACYSDDIRVMWQKDHKQAAASRGSRGFKFVLTSASPMPHFLSTEYE